ncbi:MAG TPA: MFS transporter [Solirubrobacteraceae bacterium]|nr:MFS transporter [Solirubrobacteraceae bacterium]
MTDGADQSTRLTARYREFLRLPGAARLLVGSLAGRLPLGMSSLAVLLLVHLKTGSFATAGIAVGAYTLSSAFTTPLQGRLVDRIGGPPVLIAFALAQAVGMVALVVAAQLRAPSGLLILLAAIAGAMTPPLSASVRALWPRVAPSTATLEAAYQLDATSQEVIWTCGPLLVAAAVAAGSPAAAVLLSGAITVAGTFLFATAPPARDWRGAGPGSERPTAIANPALQIVLAATLLLGLGIGAIEVALPALAVHHGSHSAAGVLLGLWSIGSLLGGLTYGGRLGRTRVTARYVGLMLLVAATSAPLIVAGSLAAAFPLSLLAGVGFAPLMACQYSLVGALADRRSVTEAFAWTSTALVSGIAGGNAVAGALVQGGGIARTFAFGCLTQVVAAIIALSGRHRLATAVARGRSQPLAAAVNS